MYKDLEEIFAGLALAEPPKNLLGKIMRRIEIERKLSTIRRRVAIFSVFALGSLVALIPSLNSVRAGIYESGFSRLFSLMFSDFDAVISFWQNYAISLLETAPVMNITLLLVVALVFLGSAKLLAKDIGVIFKSRNLIS